MRTDGEPSRRRGWLPLCTSILLLIAALVFDEAAALAQQGDTVFVGRASNEPVTQPRSDGNVTIQGRIVDQSGRPVPGVQVRFSWSDGSTTTVSNVSGGFVVTLGAGPYQAELTNRPSRVVAFAVDPQNTARIEFVETQVAGTPLPASPAAGASPTAGANRSATPGASSPTRGPTSTPPPNAATRTALANTTTPTPVLTPVPDVGAPIPLIGSAPTARPQGTPPSRPAIRRAFEFEPDIEPWLSAFLYGVGISTAAAVFYLVIVAIRR